MKNCDHFFPAPHPTDAVGFSIQENCGDVYSKFVNPPAGYGEVAFFWWLGDTITKPHLQWILDQVRDHHLCGLQVNYAHSTSGGRTFGLSYVSDPPLFSDPWWELFCWFLAQAREYGISVSLSDYTLGTPGQGWYTDAILKESPDMAGSLLTCSTFDFPDPQKADLTLTLPSSRLSVVAVNTANPQQLIPLEAAIQHDTLTWSKPVGSFQILCVCAEEKPYSLNPMHPKTGEKVVEKFFSRFEAHCPNEKGKGLNFFFSDELDFGISGNLWDSFFAQEFLTRKGYDLVPFLAALFTDIGALTPKVRLDYTDVLVALEEEHYFRPVFSWHQQGGMIYGCDHGGRGKDVTEFGDYFRTQRWNQGPGNDQPRLECEVIKSKVSSSISHLYQRPRCWLEGYHSSGWETSCADLTDATLRNFTVGHNMLSLHGLYYSTYGGYWEWAPPCNHFRMPYWKHNQSFMQLSERLSYLLSQGVHRCDVAILYPVTAVAADHDQAVVDAIFRLAQTLFDYGIDFDFIDDESVERAQVQDGKLCVSKEEYAVLILPAAKTTRSATMEKALALFNGGGTVIATGRLPDSDNIQGVHSTLLTQQLQELFQSTTFSNGTSHTNRAQGNAICLQEPDQVISFINDHIVRDFMPFPTCKQQKQTWVLHRKIDTLDVYQLYGVPKSTPCFFRTKGKAELWNPWTGTHTDLHDFEETPNGTMLKTPLEANEAQLIVFRTDLPANTQTKETLCEIAHLHLPDVWNFHLLPCLDNRWGDYEIPAYDDTVGAQIRKLKTKSLPASCDCSDKSFDDHNWEKETITYTTRFYQLTLPKQTDITALIQQLTPLDCSVGIPVGEQTAYWQPCKTSLRYGIEGEPGKQGYHGLKKEFDDCLIGLGKVKENWFGYEYEPDDKQYLIGYTVYAQTDSEIAYPVCHGIAPQSVYLNGTAQCKDHFTLHKGVNTVLLSYNQTGRTAYLLQKQPEDPAQRFPLSMKWFRNDNIYLPCIPQEEDSVCWYRFLSPPALQQMDLQCYGKIAAWADGAALCCTLLSQKDGINSYRISIPNSCPDPVNIAIRLDPSYGYSGGAAFADVIRLTCGEGTFALGDWSQNESLTCYSGGAVYTTTVAVDSIAAVAVLDLGKVCSSAEVQVNGDTVGVRVAPPWKFDLSAFLHCGENEIKVTVYNTLSNHYHTIPSKYKGTNLTSGLLGPATLTFFKREEEYHHE